MLFQLVAEVSFGLLSEFVAELGIARTFRRPLDAFKATASPLAVVGATALGAALAAGATWAFPVRLLPGIPLTGISLVVSPAIAAVAMTRWGRWRRARGGVTSVLTTPAGAAGFALGFAIVRVFWLHWLELAASS